MVRIPFAAVFLLMLWLIGDTAEVNDSRKRSDKSSVLLSEATLLFCGVGTGAK